MNRKNIYAFLFIISLCFCSACSISAQTYFALTATAENSNSIEAIVIYKGEMYVAGNFDGAANYSHISCKNIAKRKDSAWEDVGKGVNGYILSMIVYNDELYVAGSFDSAGGMPVSNIAKWNGTTWSSVGKGVTGFLYVPSFDDGCSFIQKERGGINTLCIYKGELYGGGLFDTAGGIPVNNIAKWDGKTWSTVGTGVKSINNEYWAPVSSLLEYNGELYAGGALDSAGKERANHIAKWNGSEWNRVEDGVEFDIKRLAIYHNHLYAGGSIDESNNIIYKRRSTIYPKYSIISKWDGKIWSIPGKGIPGYKHNKLNHIYSMLVFNNELYLGGSLLKSSGNVVAWNEDKWLPKVKHLNSWIDCLAIVGDKLYMSGWIQSPYVGMFLTKWDGTKWRDLRLK